MTRLRVQFLDNKVLRQRLYQVEFLTTSTGEALISLIYHRKLDEIWETEAKQLSQVLNAHIIGRSRKQRIIVSQNWVEETFQVLGRDYIYRQYENSFTQPNAVVAQNMLIWACEQASNLNGSMVELYCGIGNFTLPLSQQFERVIATEVAKISIKAANHNAEVNDIGNIEFIRGSSEDFSRDWLKSGKASDDLKTLFVDPPRAGLDKDTLALARYFETIIYISCNPDTLLANCSELSDEFVIQEFAFFDQFPYTHHMECGALLIRKTN